jgi:protein dopey
MLAPIAESGGARPYKIFISFLDKWEIGSPLTEILILDALKAVHHTRSEQGQVDDALEAEVRDRPTSALRARLM